MVKTTAVLSHNFPKTSSRSPRKSREKVEFIYIIMYNTSDHQMNTAKANKVDRI